MSPALYPRPLVRPGRYSRKFRGSRGLLLLFRFDDAFFPKLDRFFDELTVLRGDSQWDNRFAIVQGDHEILNQCDHAASFSTWLTRLHHSMRGEPHFSQCAGWPFSPSTRSQGASHDLQNQKP